MAAPTVTITNPDPLIGGNDLPTVTFTFSEPVFNFGLEDISSPGGFFTLFDIVSSSVFTARFNPFPDTDINNAFIRVNLAGLTDRSATPAPGVGVSDSATFEVDTRRPTVTSFTISDPVLRVGETATVTVVFSEAVTLPIGGLFAQQAVYSNLATADGGITYTATLTPNVNAQSNSVIALQLNGATDAAGNTTGAAQPGPNLNLNTIRPGLTITIDDDTVKAGQTATVTFTFSESVNGFDFSDISAFGIAGSLQSPFPTGLTTFTATFVPFTDVTDLTNVFSVDMTGLTSATSGNTGVGLVQSPNIAVDTQRPTVAVTLADDNLAAGQTGLVTFTFSEAVSGFTNADLMIENGTLSAVASGDGGITWTATFTPTAAINDASNVITVDRSGVTDGFGNAGTGTETSPNYAIDSTRPTLLSVTLPNADLHLGAPMIVEFVFSEVITGFTTADITFPNARMGNPVSADGITWLAAMQPPTGAIEDATNVLTIDLAGIADPAGNAGVGTATSANYAVDTIRPEVTITLADAALAAGETTLVTFTFNGPVTGFDSSKVQAENGSVSAPGSSDGGRTWTATYTPNVGVDDATNRIQVSKAGIFDPVGNQGTSATLSPNFIIDSTAPTATVSISDTAVTDGEAPTITITFSEPMATFALTAPNGSVGPYTITNGGLTYTATFTPDFDVADMTNMLTLTSGRDVVGNLLTGSPTSANYTVATSSPPVEEPTGPPPGPPPPPPSPPAPPPPVANGVEVLSGSVNSDVVTGTFQANMVAGGDGADSVTGDAGDDTISGDAGADNLQGNTGLDSISGGTGDDILHGGQDSDLVQGGADDDMVFGDRGEDTVHGGQGADHVFGGDGNDVLSGDRGDDTLTGGAGADTFRFAGSGSDRVTDFNRTEGDLIRLEPGAVFTAAQVGTDTVVTIAGTGQLTLAGVQLSSLSDGWILAG